MMLVAAGNDVDVSDADTKSKLMAAKLKEKAQLNTSRNYCRGLQIILGFACGFSIFESYMYSIV